MFETRNKISLSYEHGTYLFLISNFSNLESIRNSEVGCLSLVNSMIHTWAKKNALQLLFCIVYLNFFQEFQFQEVQQCEIQPINSEHQIATKANHGKYPRVNFMSFLW